MTVEDLKKAVLIKKQFSELKKNVKEFIDTQDWGIHLTVRGFLDLFPNGEYEIHEHTLSFPRVYEVSQTYDGERVFCLVDEITKIQIEGDMT